MCGRILSRDEILAEYGCPRDVRLVFTNGVFDLLHRGHVDSLQAARRLGDVLVVGLNSDGSARRLKGPERPFQPQEDRAAIVAALRCVDAVTIFEEDTPGDLVAALLPDVLVKGADYEGRAVAGSEAVIAAGGQVRLLPLIEGRSTTALAARLRAVTLRAGGPSE